MAKYSQSLKYEILTQMLRYGQYSVAFIFSRSLKDSEILLKMQFICIDVIP